MTSGIHQALVAAIAIGALLFGTSCSGPAKAEPAGPGDPQGALSPEEERALEARAAVERLVRTEDYRAALAAADLALEELAPSVHTAAIRRMRQVAWDEHVRRDLIKTGIQFENQPSA